MTYNIVVTREAEIDLLEIVYYYTFCGENLGEYFLNSYDHVVAKIKEKLLVFRQVRKNTRRALMNKFPYTVTFTILGEDLHIICVLHHKRKPKLWQQRIREFKMKNR